MPESVMGLPLHPLVVHVPIGVLLLLVVVEVPPSTDLDAAYGLLGEMHGFLRAEIASAIDLHIVSTLVTLDDGTQAAFGSLPVSGVGAHHVLELMEALRASLGKKAAAPAKSAPQEARKPPKRAQSEPAQRKAAKK